MFPTSIEHTHWFNDKRNNDINSVYVGNNVPVLECKNKKTFFLYCKKLQIIY